MQQQHRAGEVSSAQHPRELLFGSTHYLRNCRVHQLSSSRDCHLLPLTKLDNRNNSPHHPFAVVAGRTPVVAPAGGSTLPRLIVSTYDGNEGDHGTHGLAAGTTAVERVGSSRLAGGDRRSHIDLGEVHRSLLVEGIPVVVYR
jgi:hypothetical protein